MLHIKLKKMESQEEGQANALFLIGESGAGKSSMINRILGKTAALVQAGESATSKCAFYVVSAGKLAGCVLVDTPGLFDSRGVTDKEIIDEIKSGFKTLKVGYVRGILLLHNLAECRIRIRAVVDCLKSESFDFKGSLIIALTHTAEHNRLIDNQDGVAEKNLETVFAQIKEAGSPPYLYWDSKYPISGQEDEICKHLVRIQPGKIDWVLIERILQLLVQLTPMLKAGSQACTLI
jgi:ABC-type dipeptide/oligopeptide/nickel transport system ATPase component